MAPKPTQSLLRLLQPRAPTLRLQTLSSRAASSSIKSSRSSNSKPIVLEKPSKFTPPSHAARLPRRGAPRGAAALPTYERSERERENAKRKQYPHMMPPEGTFLHWFLTNRSIHVWITMSILTTLAFFTFLTNFITSTPFRAQLPPNTLFLSHPIAFISQYFQVYALHTEYISEQTAEHRRQKVEDVRKRGEYRKAHGLEDKGLFGGWSAREDGEVMGPGMKESGLVGGGLEQEVGFAEQRTKERVAAAAAREGEEVLEREEEAPRRRPVVKKWLGIW